LGQAQQQEDIMRKTLVIGAGVATAGVLAIAGITSANAATGSRPNRAAAAQSSAPTTTVSQAEAEERALAAFPGSTLVETRLDTDNGRLVWNVHLSTADGPVEVRVDAETGQLRIDGAAPGDNANGAVNDEDNDAVEDQFDDNDRRGRDDDRRGDDGNDDNDRHNRGSDDGPGHH
jgi:uncharacterized membrane protein YkoI